MWSGGFIFGTIETSLNGAAETGIRSFMIEDGAICGQGTFNDYKQIPEHEE